MTKDVSKGIMNKSKQRNMYLKWPSRENLLAMKSVKNFCNNLITANKKPYFQKITVNKAFWSTIKPFLTNKRFLTSNSISLIQENSTITDKKKITFIQLSLRKYCEKKHQVKLLR